MTRKPFLILSSMDDGASLAEEGERVATDEFARPDCDMFEAQTYPEWVDTS